ncbi:hypothetical protein VTJ83DRAFT_5534 [Remersonia thermophila]|uniref:lytic cellulose monooxygenase (C4-dehydrogenating) n=1 Tax=Remersonia thermophila TaxID=72144 RepID=A0ABR4D742_9PEZI
MSRFAKSLASILAGASLAAAHGHVQHIIINGVQYPSFDPTSHPYMQNPPTVVGWTAANTDNGFVAPDEFAGGNIICHKSATNAGGYAVVAAGDKVYIQWDQWPESHHGPVIDYLASCGSTGCDAVNKADLEFFKIGEVGLIDGRQAPGFWGSDQLIANNAGWLVQIPSDLAPGHYVLRHEIIALHAAGQLNGAQNYPQCFNLLVTGSGSAVPRGVKGTALYTPNDKGILAGIYNAPVTYEIPGPALYSNAARGVQQSVSVATSTASALTGGAVPVQTQAPPAITTTASSSPATSTAAASTTVTRGSGNGGRPVPTRCPGLAGRGFDKRRRQAHGANAPQKAAVA